MRALSVNLPTRIRLEVLTSAVVWDSRRGVMPHPLTDHDCADDEWGYRRGHGKQQHVRQHDNRVPSMRNHDHRQDSDAGEQQR
jgi:hypothetical protein